MRQINPERVAVQNSVNPSFRQGAGEGSGKKAYRNTEAADNKPLEGVVKSTNNSPKYEDDNPAGDDRDRSFPARRFSFQNPIFFQNNPGHKIYPAPHGAANVEDTGSPVIEKGRNNSNGEHNPPCFFLFTLRRIPSVTRNIQNRLSRYQRWRLFRPRRMPFIMYLPTPSSVNPNSSITGVTTTMPQKTYGTKSVPPAPLVV